MKKKIIVLICVIAAAIAALAIIFFSHDVSIMTVETNAAHYEYELFHVNPFFKYKMKSTANTQEKFHTIRQDHENRAMEWYEYVTGHDKNALNSEYRKNPISGNGTINNPNIPDAFRFFFTAARISGSAGRISRSPDPLTAVIAKKSGDRPMRMPFTSLPSSER